MRTTIETWHGTDEDLLAELNEPTIEIVDDALYTSRHVITHITTADEYRLFARPTVVRRQRESP